MVSPCFYLFPLQQFYTVQARAPSHSPAPHYPAASPPSRPPEVQPPAQYPPPSPSPHYDHQTPPVEPPCPTEPPYPQPAYQGVTQPQRMPVPWQPMPPPRNPSYPVGYASPPPPFPGAPPTSSQGYHPGQGPVHPMYPSGGPQYPRYPLGYQPSSTPEELQVSQGVMEQLQPTNGDSMVGHGLVRVLGPLEGPPAANVANTDNNRTIIVTSNYAVKEGNSLTRTVLLVDPPLNNEPILAVVSDPDIKEASKATMKPGSIPGSPSSYRGHRRPHNPAKTYIPSGVPDPAQLGYPLAMGEPLSVACSTEEDFEGEGYPVNSSGRRRGYRGRGREGGY
ncbi:proline-rich protein 2 [Austrofundulus limnaeus]|uniref:Proline-rich protein 2 n=1 Tax=Austrofundulus limnaeus TaxID=52670 RepID=A0A2I4AVP4_AUSLI|nr:PREDICTED: proline-rich protein 2-like [Austrofundulus limnaeus]